MSIVTLFPGQGSQHVGMGLELYEQDPAARAVFDQADAQLGFAITSLCFQGPEADLTLTVNQQPALFVTGYAAWVAMQAAGWPRPAFVAGHSLGELTALAAAGSLSFADGLALVRRRGELMALAGERNPGAMAAVLGMDADPLAAICAEATATAGAPVQIANDNCPGQIVISGDETALATAVALAEAAGVRRIVTLPITIAAHSPLMATVAADFAAAVDATPIQAPTIPVIGNVSAAPLRSPDDVRAELKAQLTSPVRWTEAMNYLLSQGADTFIEAGPGDVLSKLMRRIDRAATRITYHIEMETPELQP